jgi:hypothetical protein
MRIGEEERKWLVYLGYYVSTVGLTTAALYPNEKTTHSGVGGKKQSNDLAVTPAHIM